MKNDLHKHISLGENCLINNLLKKYGLKKESFTFGWGRSNIDYNFAIIKDNFKHLLDKMYLYNAKHIDVPVVRNSYYKSISSCINPYIDFEFTHFNVIDNEEHIESFKRKIKRFQNIIKSDTKITFWYHYRHHKKNNIKELINIFRDFSDYLKKEYNKYASFIILTQIIGEKEKKHEIVRDNELQLLSVLTIIPGKEKRIMMVNLFKINLMKYLRK